MYIYDLKEVRGLFGKRMGTSRKQRQNKAKGENIVKDMKNISVKCHNETNFSQWIQVYQNRNSFAYFLVSMIKYLNKKWFLRGRVYFGLQFKGIIHHGGESWILCDDDLLKLAVNTNHHRQRQKDCMSAHSVATLSPVRISTTPHLVNAMTFAFASVFTSLICL